MTDRREKLQRLLDGELDEQEIVNDPTMASLAERIFGMDVKALSAQKKSPAAAEAESKEATSDSQSGLMVEFIPEAGSDLLRSQIPPPPPAIPKGSVNSRKPLLIGLGLLALGVSLYNMFIGIGEVYQPCASDWCADNSKFIWLAPHKLAEDGGWGAVGSKGIPDFAMIAGSLALTLLGMRRKKS